MRSSGSGAGLDWRFIHFGLIVTGETEKRCLPELFRSMAATRRCSFSVIRRIGQRSPIRSDRRLLKMVGSGKTIPDRDVTEIGLPARNYLSSGTRYVLLIDDLEAGRSDESQDIFIRYRRTFDTILTPIQSRRASVHFLVNMLEAYYFADSRAVNSVLDTELDDYEGDVETIRNPKALMKNLHPGFDTVKDGCRIIGRLTIPHVLSRKDACASLRTLFAWVYKAIGEPDCELRQHLVGGYNDVTKGQICALSP